MKPLMKGRRQVMTVTWRVANSLLKLRDQINKMAPNRSKASDGTIGNEEHMARDSDHNAWIVDGQFRIVSALDITHDPLDGVDCEVLAETFRKAKDKRIKYIIWNKRICSPVNQAWRWRPYTGKNSHEHHIHISVSPTKVLYDDMTDWSVPSMVPNPDAPQVHERPLLYRGMPKSEDVKQLQTLLGFKGKDVDGGFGEMTEKAVKAFQLRVGGLVVDGRVGSMTWKALLGE